MFHSISMAIMFLSLDHHGYNVSLDQHGYSVSLDQHGYNVELMQACCRPNSHAWEQSQQERKMTNKQKENLRIEE